MSVTAKYNLIEYQKQGYKITLASGRYYKEVERFAKQLKLDEENYDRSKVDMLLTNQNGQQKKHLLMISIMIYLIG